MELKLDTNVFKELDKTILDDFKSDENLTVDDIYGKNGWYLKLKRESKMMNLLVQNKKQFDRLNITIDKVVILISALNIYIGDRVVEKYKTFVRVPDRLLCNRAECSRETLIQILLILNRLCIVSLDTRSKYPKVRLNYQMLEEDPYFIFKCKTKNKLNRTNLEKHIKIENMYGTDYYYDYNYFVYKNKFTEAVLGLILAYNDIILDHTNQFRKNRIIKYLEGEEVSSYNICYVEACIHWIASILHVSEEEVQKKLSNLCNHTDYISKHQLVYSDVKLQPDEYILKNTKIINPEHFYNDNYKSYAKNEYYKFNDEEGNSYELNHPRVTQFSYIIYLDKLKQTRVGKRITKNYRAYYNTLLSNMFVNQDNNLLYRDDISVQLAEKRSGNNIKNIDINDFNDEDGRSFRDSLTDNLYDDTSTNGKHIINLYSLMKEKHFNNEEYVPRLKVYHNPLTLSNKRLVNILALIIYKVPDCMTKDLTYYIKLFNNLEDIVLNRMLECYTHIRNISNKSIPIDEINKYTYNLGQIISELNNFDERYNINLLETITNQLKEEVIKTEWFKKLYLCNQIYHLDFEAMERNYIEKGISNKGFMYQEAITSALNLDYFRYEYESLNKQINKDKSLEIWKDVTFISDNYEGDYLEYKLNEDKIIPKVDESNQPSENYWSYLGEIL